MDKTFPFTSHLNVYLKALPQNKQNMKEPAQLPLSVENPREW